MGEGFKPLGGRGEFLLVVVGAFGVFTLLSLWYAFDRVHYPGHSNASLCCTILYEVIILAVLGSLLSQRGWSARALGLVPNWTDVPIGIAFAVLSWCFYVWSFWILAAVLPGLAKGAASIGLVKAGLSPWAVGAVVLVNPVYEELFVTGYVIGSLKTDSHVTTAINVSVAIRLLYHLYQGVVGVLAIVPLGLLFAYWFARTRRLWPLVIAHALLDALAFIGHIGP